MSKKPFVVALCCGDSKPPIELFFNDFVAELADLRTNGLDFLGKPVSVEDRLFCCDTPAEELVKCTISSNVFFWCDNLHSAGCLV